MVGGIVHSQPVGQIDPQNAAEATRALESMFLEQLLSAMGSSLSKSGLFGEGFQGEMFMDMFMSSVADEASRGGLGFGSMIEGSAGLGGGDAIRAAVTSSRGAISYGAVPSQGGQLPFNGRLARIVDGWIGDEKAARWSKEGKLDETDLAAQVETDGRGGEARFNVRDAGGYRGHNKCNLFAFEMIRRSGYKVPLAARNRGWGYMGADTVARKAQSGKLSWAEVKTDSDANMLDSIAAGGAPIVMASSASGDREGHMGVADRVHEIRRDEHGNIVRLEYSGWEASRTGARYGKKVWRLAGESGPGRGGLDNIQILVPHVPTTNERFDMGNGAIPGASVLDQQVERNRYAVAG